MKRKKGFMNVDRLVDTDGMFFVYKEPKIIKNVDAQYQKYL